LQRDFQPKRAVFLSGCAASLSDNVTTPQRTDIVLPLIT
jgi:hypothetical protein